MRRRGLVSLVGALVVAAPSCVAAGPELDPAHLRLVPLDKGLDPAWVRRLAARGEREVRRGGELDWIGMPIGGLCAGTLYMGGDGRLWLWDVFNKSGRGGLKEGGTSGQAYVKPLRPESPFEQRFVLLLRPAGGEAGVVLPLDRTGGARIEFAGEYPIADVVYRWDEAPVEVALRAFSPFVPLDFACSSFPATVLRYTVRNKGSAAVSCVLGGVLENAIGRHTGKRGALVRHNRIEVGPGFKALTCAAEEPPAAPGAPARPDLLFEDFEQPTYEGWTVEGAAFGAGPIEKGRIPSYQRITKLRGGRMVNSHATAPGNSIEEKDAQTGKLVSRAFRIERRHIAFLIGGGAHAGRTGLDLVVDGRVVASATGHNDNELRLDSFDVAAHEDKEARLVIVDAESGPWGNIGVDHIVFCDGAPGEPYRLREQHDWGTMSLAVVGGGERVSGCAQVGKAESFCAAPDCAAREARAPFGERLLGAVGRAFTLEPGREESVVFIAAWHFPNLYLPGLPGNLGRYYATRAASSFEVAAAVAGDLENLTALTELWHRTWYRDSTLPWWFLNRTFVNTSILATDTAYRFANGRFYGWEGIDCCPGTCGHVWMYAQAVGRLFPELERDLRERVDLDLAMQPSGAVHFRAEHNRSVAVDGQAGVVLRAYREHQMTADAAFLARNWPAIARALSYLIRQDGDGDGLLEGAQHNTLDADWYGRIPAMSSLYLAALKAGNAMAEEVGDAEFAALTARILAAGRKNILALFNGRYFIQVEDPAYPDAIGVGAGCHIDNVFGQSWAFQVGLGRIIDAGPVRTALDSLWKFNFAPDVGPLRASLPDKIKGRPYALAGEAGLLMCTWPLGGGRADRQRHWQYGYFNECMTGFEYQVAGHMLWEGMVERGLAVTRAVHDRYAPAKRNPYNEIECSYHYARAMASYGVFLAACGYEHHGPKGSLAFAPRLSPEDFSAAFTAAGGWGLFAQKRAGAAQRDTLELRWGSLTLRSFAFEAPGAVDAEKVRAELDGRPIECEAARDGARILVTFPRPVVLRAPAKLVIDAG